MTNSNSGGGSLLFLTGLFMLVSSVLGLKEMNANKKKGPSRGFLIFAIVWSSLLMLQYVFKPIGFIFKAIAVSG